MTTFAEVIAGGLSAERFGPYCRAAGNDDTAALALYEWNTRISAALWADIADLEVLVRNTLNAQLIAWSTRLYGEPVWYRDPSHILTGRHRADVAEACRRATTGARAKPETIGRVVAELGFGFWRFLLATEYDRTLWHGCLYRAFPGEGRRKRVHAVLSRLHNLRNRIAHHEPIHREPLAQHHAALLQVLEWINPTYRDWVEIESTVPAVLNARPNTD